MPGTASSALMELQLLKGPLDDARLAAIADLYGAYNRKYRDVAFCRRLFNENPHGYSLHALLVHESGRTVGHYGAIPIDILVDGERRLSGKGEAFVVHEGHRGATLSLPGEEPMACGLAMPLHLYRFARNQGMELVHMIADPAVGLIHRMTGCRALPIRHVKARLAVRPLPAPSPDRAAWRTVARTALAAGQSLLSGIAAGALAGGPAARVWRGADLTPAALARIAADACPGAGWTVAVDAPLLAWLGSTGDLDVIALDEAMDDYAVVCGRVGDAPAREIVLWRQRSGGIPAAVRLLAAVVRHARHLGDATVACSHGAAWDAAELARLRAAGRHLFFHESERSANLYVHTADRYYLDAQNLRFTPIFYSVF
jgi:hypothetical protein